MSSPFTKEEVEWWKEQAEKLKPFWLFFKDISCNVIIKIMDSVLREMGCEKVESYMWNRWECKDKSFFAFNGVTIPYGLKLNRLEDVSAYPDMLRDYGLFGVGIDIFDKERKIECALRILQKADIHLPFVDISFNDIIERHGSYFIKIILGKRNAPFLEITPHKKVELQHYGQPLTISEELALEEIKRITQWEDVRKRVEQAIDEAVKFFNELLLPTVTYILY